MKETTTSNEAYGRPLSGRVDYHLATRIIQDAADLHISVCKYIGLLIATGFDARKQLNAAIEREREAVGAFIRQMAGGDERRMEKLITEYNHHLKNSFL